VDKSEPPVYEIAEMVEKPTIDYARAHLQTPGLPDGEYLCFFGIHVFPPAIFACLEHLIQTDTRVKGEIQLTSAQERLLSQQRYLISEVQGVRYDMGVPEGLVETQIALALHSPFEQQARTLLTR
jgi:UTP--glucose-1-phosphate uridylyltransferase